MNAKAWVCLLFLASQTASAAVTLKIDESRFLSVGLGLRMSASAGAVVPTDGAATTTRPELFPEIALVGATGQLHPSLRMQLNVAASTTGAPILLDAIAQFEPHSAFKLWAGRMLPPVDRASLTGPLFSSTWELPIVGIRAALAGGREDGVTAWGDVLPDRVRYRVGVFRGVAGEAGSINGLQFAGRLTFSLLDAEPGYFHSGTTFGARDVLTFGLGARHQLRGSDPARNPEVLTLVADALFEKKLGNDGVFTAETGVFRHDGGALDPAFRLALGVYAQAGYMLGARLGPGRFQFVGRYQVLDELGSALRRTREDLTTNYVVQGHPLRLSLVLSRDVSPDVTTRFAVRLGAQFIL